MIIEIFRQYITLFSDADPISIIIAILVTILSLFLRRVITIAADSLYIVVLTRILSSDQFQSLPPRLQERVIELTKRRTINTGIGDNLPREPDSTTPNQTEEEYN
jgi:hypothetical protein